MEHILQAYIQADALPGPIRAEIGGYSRTASCRSFGVIAVDFTGHEHLGRSISRHGDARNRSAGQLAVLGKTAFQRGTLATVQGRGTSAVAVTLFVDNAHHGGAK